MTSGRHLAAVVLVAALITAACGGAKTDGAAAASKEAQVTLDVPTVTTVRAVTRDVTASVQATGGFAAEESSNVAPESPGVILTTLVNVGDFVQQGQVIARLDDRDAKLRLDQALAAQQQAEASVRQAQSKIGLGQNQNFDPSSVPEVLAAKAAYESAQAQARLAAADAQRYANLVESGDVSRSAYDKAKTAVETAEAQANAARQQYEATLNTARQNYGGVETQQASLQGIRAQLALARKAVEDTEIRAPFAGYVSARPVTAGEYVSSTSTIATVVRLTPIKLELQVPENYAPQIKVGLKVEASVPGYPGRVFEGRVKAVNPSVESNSRTFTTEVEFRNADRALKPGMFATARVELPGSQRGIFVPRQAVLTDATTNSSQVFMVRDGKARLAVV
jgi:multidrug resistance efflux pump